VEAESAQHRSGVARQPNRNGRVIANTLARLHSLARPTAYTTADFCLSPPHRTSHLYPASSLNCVPVHLRSWLSLAFQLTWYQQLYSAIVPENMRHTNSSLSRRRVGRPPAGDGGEKVSGYAQVTVRLPARTKALLNAVTGMTGLPAWRIFDAALGLYVEKLPREEQQILSHVQRRRARAE
jgi:hypothetical protein